MAISIRKLLAAAGTGILLLTLLVSLPGDSSAANLTGGQYTYVISGEEVAFPIDPLSRKDGILLPIEVFQALKITVDGAMGRTFTLKRANVTATVTLGNTLFDLNGKTESTAPAAVRLNGRLFAPADLLKHFGVEHAVDGTFLTMNDSSAGMPDVQETAAADFSAMKVNKSFSAAVKADTNVHLTGEFTLLTPELITSSRLDLRYADRVKLYNLLRTNTLVLVRLTNTNFRSGAMTNNSLYLVDSKRRQYDMSGTVDIGEGSITVRLAPDAERSAVILFPRLINEGPVTLWYDAASTSLGTFVTP